MVLTTNSQKGIVTTEGFLYASDGHSYRSFFGLCSAINAQDFIGCRTGSGQADFLIKVGTINPLFISGCQFHSFQACDQPPPGNAYHEVR